jgi:hypothetical protein
VQPGVQAEYDALTARVRHGLAVVVHSLLPALQRGLTRPIRAELDKAVNTAGTEDPARAATRFFSDDQIERLRSFPDIGWEELVWFFTLAQADLGVVDNRGRGSEARVGLALRLGTLPWLGFISDDLQELASESLVSKLSGWLPLITAGICRRVIVRGDGPFADRLFRFWRGRDWLRDGIGKCRPQDLF